MAKTGDATTPLREQQRQRSLKTALRCARIADDYRGRDTLVLDLTPLTPIVDFFVITTGTSRRQMRAIAEEIHRVLKEEGQQRLGIEGEDSNQWILLDYGDVVIHIFDEESRHRYDLEHLWADAQRIDWKAAAENNAEKNNAPDTPASPLPNSKTS